MRCDVWIGCNGTDGLDRRIGWTDLMIDWMGGMNGTKWMDECMGWDNMEACMRRDEWMRCIGWMGWVSKDVWDGLMGYGAMDYME